MKYYWPQPGAHEPFELHHYIAVYLYGNLLTLKEKGKPRFNVTRGIICGLLERYANGTYQYRGSKSFNPLVATDLKGRVDVTVRQGATIKGLSNLAESLERAINRHYLEIGRPDKTEKAIEKFKNKLRAERSR